MGLVGSLSPGIRVMEGQRKRYLTQNKVTRGQEKIEIASIFQSETMTANNILRRWRYKIWLALLLVIHQNCHRIKKRGLDWRLKKANFLF